ncbi:hypothetical protein OG21DRAFT_1518175 [Imleria badia]|nr:hypothetical protein OG21DRAFT_1518175 [Imleria badia]
MGLFSKCAFIGLRTGYYRLLVTWNEDWMEAADTYYATLTSSDSDLITKRCPGYPSRRRPGLGQCASFGTTGELILLFLTRC